MTALLWIGGWFAAAAGVAVVVGRAIRNADDHCCWVAHDDIDDELRAVAEGDWL